MTINKSKPSVMSTPGVKNWIQQFRKLGKNFLVNTYSIEDETLEQYARGGYSTMQAMGKLLGFGVYDVVVKGKK